MSTEKLKLEGALTYDEAEKLALSAIHDTDGRGMIGRGRNHLHQRVARAIIHAARREAALTAWNTRPSVVPDREGVPAANKAGDPPYRYHLTEPTVTISTRDGVETLGEGWLLISEAEYAILSMASEALTDAAIEVRDALDFFDRVKSASEAEQIAVGTDHWDRLEAAARRVAAAILSGEG